MMQWIDENSKDVEMLKRVDMSPLDIGPAEGSEQLARKVQRHNKAMSDLTEQFDNLAADRKHLANADHWFDHDSKAVLAKRRRAVAESWDVLVTLGRLIQDRQNLLQQLQAHVAGKVSDMEQQCSQAFDSAHSALKREHRSYLKTEPVRGPAWVKAEADSDDAIVALRKQIAPLQDTLNKLGSAYHRTGRNNALTFRQREVYEQLN